MHGRAFTSVNGRSAVDKDDKLTLAGETWQLCMTGVSYEQVTGGLSKLATTDEYDNYSITAKQFRTLCLSVGKPNVPSIEQVIDIFTNSLPLRHSTVASRFKHPLALAIWAKGGFNKRSFCGLTAKQCRDKVMSIYEFCLNNYADFLPEHFEEKEAIAAPMPDRFVALSALSSLKANLGLINDLPEKTITATAEEIKREIMARDPETQARKQKMLMEAKKEMEELANGK